MSKINVELNDNILTINKDSIRKKNEEKIDISKLVYGEVYASNLRATNQKQYNKILFMQQIEREDGNELIKDVKKRVDSLKKSLNIFKEVYKMLKESIEIFGDREDLQENILMCEEMIGMIPIKIDKINKGEESI